MSRCLNQRAILEVAMNEATESAREHAAGCLACARRVAALRDDLSALRTALEAPPAVLRAHRQRSRSTWHWWVPVAVAAVAVLAIGLSQRQRAPGSALPAIGDFAREVSRAVFPDSRITVAAATDIDYLQAALSGAAPCDPLWQRCGDDALTGY